MLIENPQDDIASMAAQAISIALNAHLLNRFRIRRPATQKHKLSEPDRALLGEAIKSQLDVRHSLGALAALVDMDVRQFAAAFQGSLRTSAMAICPAGASGPCGATRPPVQCSRDGNRSCGRFRHPQRFHLCLHAAVRRTAFLLSLVRAVRMYRWCGRANTEILWRAAAFARLSSPCVAVFPKNDVGAGTSPCATKTIDQANVELRIVRYYLLL